MDADWESPGAWSELLSGLAGLDAQFLTGAKALTDEQSMAEGYKFLATALGVAFDTYLFADPTRPVFADLNTPARRDRRWGGDNTDAYYCFTPLDPTRTYRVTGHRGDSVYFSLTLYNEPEPGGWSDRIVGIVNDTDLDIGDDGRFTLVMGPRRPDGHDGPFLELTPDAAVAVTRDYQLFPLQGRRVDWAIEALDPPGSLRVTDAAVATGLRSTLRWVQEMFAVVPIAPVEPGDPTVAGHNSPGAANGFADPYSVGDGSYGWSARDAAYSFANFALGPDDALVVTHRPPGCRFWNLVAWNPFLATRNAADEVTSINGGSAVANRDGTVTTVIARQRLAHPNAISTVDHPDGMLAFRWFLPDDLPARPEARLVPVADAPTEVT